MGQDLQANHLRLSLALLSLFQSIESTTHPILTSSTHININNTNNIQS